MPADDCGSEEMERGKTVAVCERGTLGWRNCEAEQHRASFVRARRRGNVFFAVERRSVKCCSST